MPADHLPRLTALRRAVLDQQLDRFLELEPQQRLVQLQQFQTRYPRLHAWLQRLLAASDTPTAALRGAVDRTTGHALHNAMPAPRLAEGERLGPWRILGAAGRGGMGLVYRALRDDGAFEMEVAIKLIASHRPGMAERLVLERQLLARLNHAGISRLIDGGLTADGCAYLVMEWVPGEDLAESTRSRLDPFKTFGEIADALTHAHQRMVVHGDIKPGNVRITPNGRARLLDFGVARLLADEVIEPEDALRALTPAFAASELVVAAQPGGRDSGPDVGYRLCGRRIRAGLAGPDSSCRARSGAVRKYPLGDHARSAGGVVRHRGAGNRSIRTRRSRVAGRLG